MCQLCADAMQEYWPGLTRKEQNDLLWGATCFPFGDGEMEAKQLKEMAKRAKGDVGRAIEIAWDDMGKAMRHGKRRERRNAFWARLCFWRSSRSETYG